MYVRLLHVLKHHAPPTELSPYFLTYPPHIAGTFAFKVWVDMSAACMYTV